jgi:lipopolysaccharide transport system permease protein
MNKRENNDDWDIIIQPKSGFLFVNISELWRYRDLIAMFVRRDVVTLYKQTILGPIWFVLQPIMTTVIYMLVFGGIAQISTDGAPQILFYLSGITIWNYFADTFNATSQTFKTNEQIFSKVYFPRLVMPISKVIGGLIKFGIQFALFLTIYVIVGYQGGDIRPNWTIVLLPLLLIYMAGIGMGAGILFTSLTAKYRDLNFLLAFIVQLLMYASAVIFPVSSVPEKYQTIILLNPFVHIIEAFKYMFLGVGHLTLNGLLYTGVMMLVTVIVGVLIFNKTEKSFVDTV